MSQTCFICNSRVGESEDGASNIFTEYTSLGVTLVKLLSEIIGKTIPDKDLHSNVICKKCYKSCMEYDSIKNKLQNLKMDLTNQFKTTLPKHGFKYNTYPKKDSPVVLSKKIVLPASKLQPLPPDYVINVANLQGKLSPNKLSPIRVTSKNFSPVKMNPAKISLPKIVNVQSMTPKINLKVTVGSSVLTQTIKTTASPQKVVKTTENTTDTVTSLTSILNTTAPNSMINFNIESLPKDFLSSAILTKVDKNETKVEHVSASDDDDENVKTEEQQMEIDGDCISLVRVAGNENNLLIDESEKKETPEKAHYFDVSLLPLAEGSTNDTILGKLQILEQTDGDDDGNEEEETIVMTGENGSILRIVSGKKLVYENGEITLATDDENSNPEDNNDGHDSNDESQIELQVSGDEETANAIIAAAQEQGGAFIKVESGEMYRVKSVHSKSGAEIKEETTLTIVAPEGDMFKCLLCENSDSKDSLSASPPVGDAEQMMLHLKADHDARVYICQLCKKIMRKRSEYTTHLEEHSVKYNKLLSSGERVKMHECNLCKKKYSSRSLLQEHMNMHNGMRPYTCAVCQKSFASKYTHQSHLKTHLERPRPFKCKQCPKSFFSQQNLNQHQKTHLNIKDFVCNACGKAFGTQHNLEVHSVVHSGKKPFVCGVCQKGFARRAEVKDHMRIHTGERPFSCEVCGASFTQRSNLHSHRRATHMDDKRYHCADCPKKFKRRRLLDYHIKASHTGERPLQCEVCHATFVYPEHYKKHIRIHSGEKPYVCEVCGKSFNSRDNRNTHRFVHSDKKPYECLVCGAGYMRKQLLYAHMNTSGHLAESIVVNQPRVHKVNEKLLETKEDSEHETSEPKTNEAEGDDTPTLFLTEDKKLILQDGKSTINLVPETDDPTLLTFIQNLEANKTDATLQSLQVSTEQLGEQVQMVTSDEHGGIRLVQLHINSNPASWNLTQE